MNTSKKSVQSAAVSTVKAVFCIPHLALQTAADLVNVTEAKTINLIDGTPVEQSVMERALYTNAKQQAALAKIEQLKSKIEAKRERVRQAKINYLKSQLDKAEGVEHIDESTAPAKPAPKPRAPKAKKQATVPAPPAPALV